MSRLRQKHNFGESEIDLAFAPTDLNDENQQFYVNALTAAGFVTVNMDYRETHVTTKQNVKPVSSTASYVSYTLGRLSTVENVNLVIITGAFEIYSAIEALSEISAKNKIIIAFFEQYMQRS